ncbi:hypothetical protein EDD11_006982 [Mortierella claussenii]|nr:hypothetical protein EDD11_006982 [Mortierella claussenii]
MASAALSIPIAFWSKGVCAATISVSCACADYVVTGLDDGLIWVLRGDTTSHNTSSTGQVAGHDTPTLGPNTLLIGHNARVTALETMLVEGDNNAAPEWILISASEDGEVKKWNLADGRCLQSNSDAFIGVPSYLGVFWTVEKSGSGPKFIVCAGASNEACILDSTSLEVVRVWGGHLDWVYCTTLPGDGSRPFQDYVPNELEILRFFVFNLTGKAAIQYLAQRMNRIQGQSSLARTNSYSGQGGGRSIKPHIRYEQGANRLDVVSSTKLEVAYLPSVVIYKHKGTPYLLSLRNARQELMYSFASLEHIDSDVQNGNDREGQEAPVQWSSNTDQDSPPSVVTCSMMLNDTLVALGCSIEVACFNNHSRPVAHFLQVPEDVNSRIRRSVISIAEDHSVAIISIEEMSCIYLFGGYEHTLLSIQWRPPEDYIVLWHADGTAFVWQMQTGHLDRVVKGESAREIMMDSRWSVSEISSNRSHSSKLAFDCLTVKLHDDASVQTIIVNLKHILGILSTARIAEQQNDYAAFSAPAAPQPPAQLEAKPSSRRGLFSGQSRTSAKSKTTAADPPAALSESVQRCLSAAKGILSLLITEDDAHAISIRGLLGLSQPARSVALGMRGAYGNISIQAPPKGGSIGESWCVSPTLTASKLIAILSLSKLIATVQSLGVDMDTWSKGYCRAVQDAVGAKFCPPSLSYLAKYWQDPQVEIQEATKIILLSAIERMSKAEITALVKYWSAFLPAAALPDTCSSQYMARSAIILGILGAENAEALPEKVRKLVALSLTILLNDDTRVSYKVASIDLLAQGFASWQPFIRADAVLNTLFAMAMDSQPSNTLVSRRARRAIAQIATINPVLFVATLTQDILDAKKPVERMGLLKLVSIFSRKSPAVLYSGIPRLAEAIVKSLDPTVPQVRELLLPVATSVMMDLVQAFPQLDFHVGSQKLAVGTLEGAIIVYDLQTATRWQILEGHTKAVSAVSFSRDGKTIVSCSIKEGTVRFWHPNPGFFGMLMGGSGLWGHSKSSSQGSHRQGPQGGIPSLSSQQSSRTFDFALQDSVVTGPEETMLSQVRFEWTGDKVVKLSVYDHIMSFNV